MKKTPVTILGATGSVGQKFIQLLESHPWFDITALSASDKNAGKSYADAVDWMLPTAIPEKVRNMKLLPSDSVFTTPIVFSALDASVAGPIESAVADSGCIVISNARNHRYDRDVPLLIPDINADHLNLIGFQGRKGAIITNPNCSTTGLVMALKPLHDQFGIEKLHVVTMQAVSGAGYQAARTMNIDDNVIPFISGEEEKMDYESLKILGTRTGDHIVDAAFTISSQCHRVNVSDGHTEAVSIKLQTRPTQQDIIEAWRQYRGEAQTLDLPSAPLQPLHYFDENEFPQPKLHRDIDKGMATSIGRLLPCPVLQYKFVLMSHNTVRGAAGTAILNAELLVKKGHLNA